MRRVPRGIWPLLALIVATMPVAGVFTLSRIFFVRDLTMAFRSRFLFLRHAVDSGTFPLWDPYTANGQPAVNDALYQLFHLPSLPIRLLLPEVVAYNVWIAAPVPLAALGMYLFLRRHLTPLAAAFGAFSEHVLVGRRDTVRVLGARAPLCAALARGRRAARRGGGMPGAVGGAGHARRDAGDVGGLRDAARAAMARHTPRRARRGRPWRGRAPRRDSARAARVGQPGVAARHAGDGGLLVVPSAGAPRARGAALLRRLFPVESPRDGLDARAQQRARSLLLHDVRRRAHGPPRRHRGLFRPPAHHVLDGRDRRVRDRVAGTAHAGVPGAAGDGAAAPHVPVPGEVPVARGLRHRRAGGHGIPVAARRGRPAPPGAPRADRVVRARGAHLRADRLGADRARAADPRLLPARRVGRRPVSHSGSGVPAVPRAPAADVAPAEAPLRGLPPVARHVRPPRAPDRPGGPRPLRRDRPAGVECQRESDDAPGDAEGSGVAGADSAGHARTGVRGRAARGLHQHHRYRRPEIRAVSRRLHPDGSALYHRAAVPVPSLRRQDPRIDVVRSPDPVADRLRAGGLSIQVRDAGGTAPLPGAGRDAVRDSADAAVSGRAAARRAGGGRTTAPL